MKREILLGAIICLCFNSKAQMVSDSIVMNPGYTNESYYSLNNGEELNVNNTNWDIAFDLSGYGSSIRTNQHTGTEVYVYPNGVDWATVDITGVSIPTMNNSDTKWSVGSFDQSVDASNPFDLGWGIYNMVTHHTDGDSIHIIKLANGDYKKVMIENLANGVYTFKHANIDGTNEVTNSIVKSDFTDKNFAYYSITTDEILDREPANNTWDLVFTKYVTEVAPSMMYGVTGVLSNNGVNVREADGVDPSLAIYSDYVVDSVINVIGYDWKTFAGGSYILDIDKSYFVEDQSGNIWHILFTNFEGGATGKVVFGKELVTSASVDEMNGINSFGIYPNPTNEIATVAFNSNTETTQLSMIDLSGKIIFQTQINESGFITYPILVNEYQAGTYFITLKTAKGKTTKKIIVQ